LKDETKKDINLKKLSKLKKKRGSNPTKKKTLKEDEIVK
jgi:hypothetical protein